MRLWIAPPKRFAGIVIFIIIFAALAASHRAAIVDLVLFGLFALYLLTHAIMRALRLDRAHRGASEAQAANVIADMGQVGILPPRLRQWVLGDDKPPPSR